MLINHQAGYKVLKNNAYMKILVDRAVMRHISFLSEWHLLRRPIDSRVVSRHYNLS